MPVALLKHFEIPAAPTEEVSFCLTETEQQACKSGGMITGCIRTTWPFHLKCRPLAPIQHGPIWISVYMALHLILIHRLPQPTLKDSYDANISRIIRWHSGKESACQCWRHRRRGVRPWSRRVPWVEQVVQYSLLGKFHVYRPGRLQSMEPQRVEHDWAIEYTRCKHSRNCWMKSYAQLRYTIMTLAPRYTSL